MNTFLSPIYFLLILVYAISCKSQESSNQVASSTNVSTTDKFTTRSAHSSWMKHVSFQSDSIQNMYTKDAVKIFDNGNYLQGVEAIANHYKNNPIKINTISTDTLLLANKRRALEYEMGTFNDDEGNTYKHVIIWKNTTDGRKRDFEIVSKEAEHEVNSKEIDQQRSKWMEYCNAHDVEGLANHLYTSNNVYYNHKPLVIGRAQLIKEYQYMANEKYTLKLTPILSEVVNENTVFEIGQCSEGYHGKYIIIWKKNEEGIWQVLVDSNI